MKLIYEIDSDKIELSVKEALDLVHVAIIHEREAYNGVSCGNMCSQKPHFYCSRAPNHTGRHIAIGGGVYGDLVYDIWTGLENG